MKSKRIAFKYQALIPLIVILGAIIIFPLIYSFIASFKDLQFTQMGQAKFIGLDNYRSILSSKSFWKAMQNTLVFVLIAVSLEFIIGFYLAHLLYNKAALFRGFFKTSLLIPMFTTPIAIGLCFRFMLHPQLGIISKILLSIGINVDWFSPKMALFSIALIDVWQWTPFMFLLLLAGMESLPEEPFEAAKIDGAGGWKLVRYITLPMMRPIILAALMIRMLDGYKVYEYIYAITRGGPGEATESIQYHIYRVAFTYFRIGEASAMSYMLIIAISLMVIVLFYILRKGA